MGKVAFLPFSIGTGFLAGMIAKKAFALMWSVIDDQDPPQAEHREVRLAKLVAAAALEGAVFSLTRELVDHGSRHAFLRLTGSWPGEEHPADE
jgi:hypothetical protein